MALLRRQASCPAHRTAATSQLIAATSVVPGSEIDGAGEKLNSAILLVRIANWRYLSTYDQNGMANFKANFEKASAALAKVEQLAGIDEKSLVAPVRAVSITMSLP